MAAMLPRPLSASWHFVEQYFIPHYLLMFNPSSVPFLSVMHPFALLPFSLPKISSLPRISPYYCSFLPTCDSIQRDCLTSVKCAIYTSSSKEALLWLVKSIPVCDNDMSHFSALLSSVNAWCHPQYCMRRAFYVYIYYMNVLLLHSESQLVCLVQNSI